MNLSSGADIHIHALCYNKLVKLLLAVTIKQFEYFALQISKKVKCEIIRLEVSIG